jgi:hypothetical protein
MSSCPLAEVVRGRIVVCLCNEISRERKCIVVFKVELDTYNKPEREQLLRWLQQEEAYVESKFQDERLTHDLSWQTNIDKFWVPQVIQYFDRARLFLEGGMYPQALQALAKAMMTSKGCLESAIRVYGDLPRGGVPSGEIRTYDWKDV